MFNRKKKAESAAESAPAAAPLPKGYTPAKGAPTPKRADVERARRRPVVSETANLTREQKKVLKAERRARGEEIRQREMNAMRTGDYRNMPFEHRGRERAWARDFVDSRRTIAVAIMPVAILLMVGLFAFQKVPVALNIFIIAMYAVMLAMLADAIRLGIQVKRALRYRFGEANIPLRIQGQMVSRVMTPRRWRLPAPQVKAGEYPQGGSPAEYRAAYRKNQEEEKERKRIEREVDREA